jgi:hypothetical protein
MDVLGNLLNGGIAQVQVIDDSGNIFVQKDDYSYTNFNAATTGTQIFTGAGHVGVLINATSAAGIAISLYDDVGSATTLISTNTMSGTTPEILPYYLRVTTGLWVVITGTGTFDSTLTWRLLT